MIQLLSNKIIIVYDTKTILMEVKLKQQGANKWVIN